MKYYLKGKKTTRKALEEMFGKEKVANRIKEAKKEWKVDSLIEMSWMDGMLLENN